MLVSLIKKLFRDKRGATAVAMAIMTVPLLIAAGAAVDFSRIASARALLQTSVDGAAIAGAGEWQMSESSTNAYDVAQNVYLNTGARLPDFVSGSTPTVTLACTGTTGTAEQPTNQCGGSQSFATTLFPGCTTGDEYCVRVTASVTLKNSLLAFVIPSEVLSVQSIASVGYATSNAYVPIPPGTGFTSAGDFNNGYAVAVPMDGPGNTPNYNERVIPNSYCASTPGTLSALAPNGIFATPGTDVTACNYLFIANSAGVTGSGGALSLDQNQPIEFIYTNETGGNGYSSIDSTQITNNIVVYDKSTGGTGTFYQNGFSPSNTPLYGKCPDHTLYGSLDYNYGTPLSDSFNVYSSGLEILGYPPTYNTNHALTPFITTYRVHQKIGGRNYYTAAVCPDYPTADTLINAPISTSYVANNPDFVGMNIFSTWFPGQTFTDSAIAPATDSSGNALTTGVGDVFPPAIGGCTPATNATDGGVTPASSDPWWNWSGSNIRAGYCKQAQTDNYSNCTLLIQPLGTNSPTDSNGVVLMPDYYNTIESPTGTVLALDPVYDGITYTDPLTGVTVINGDPAGYTPTNVTPSPSTIDVTTMPHNSTLTSSEIAAGITGVYDNTQYVGDVIVVQEPGSSNAPALDHAPPWATANQCYDPSVATQTPTGSKTAGYNANGFAIDPIANPQLGAIICNTDPPESYAIYWNDLGTYEADDLGYWNDSYPFRCSVPPSTNANGGASLLSG